MPSVPAGAIGRRTGTWRSTDRITIHVNPTNSPRPTKENRVGPRSVSSKPFRMADRKRMPGVIPNAVPNKTGGKRSASIPQPGSRSRMERSESSAPGTPPRSPLRQSPTQVRNAATGKSLNVIASHGSSHAKERGRSTATRAGLRSFPTMVHRPAA